MVKARSDFLTSQKQSKTGFLKELRRQKLSKLAAQLATEAEERAAQLDAVFEAMVDTLLVYDTHGITVKANPAAIKLLGFNPLGTSRKVLAKSVFLRHRRGDPVSFKELPATQALQGKTIKSKYLVLRNARGHDIMVIASASPVIKRGKVMGAVSILHDVSESWLVEKQKDDFVAIASHELKTPVATIKAFTQILQKHFEKIKDRDASYYLLRMNNQLDRLIGIINELLDVTRIDAERLELNLEKVDLNILVKEIVEDFQQMVETHSIDIEVKFTKKIFADHDRLSQVFMNLLWNAIKYSPHANKVIVKGREIKDSAVISVQDFGIGISKENQKLIFGRFFRVQGIKGERFPGLGLGLYISWEIIRRHGGKMWVKSNEGEGSTFYVSLPLKANRGKI